MKKNDITEKKSSIFIVEDELLTAENIKVTLKKLGYSVTGIATCATEAISMVKENQPDLILMDIMLKGTINGIETAKRIQSFTDVPIIYLTAYSDVDTINQAKETTPFGYIVKPFENKDLYTAIEMSLYRHSMERKLKENEESLSTTLNSIGDGVIATDPNGLIERMNPVAEKMCGWKIDEAKGKKLEVVFNIINAETRRPIANPVNKVLSTGKNVHLANHTVLINKDGTEKHISDCASPIRNSKGEITGVVLVFSDVTEAYQAREEIRISENKFRNLVTEMEQGLAVHEVIYDENGKVVDYRFLEVTNSYENLTGLKRKDIIGKTVLEVIPNVEQYWIDTFGNVAVTGKSTQYENYVKEFDRYYNTVVYRPQLHQFAVIVTDITERKKTEIALQESEELHRKLLMTVPDLIIRTNLKGEIIFINEFSFGSMGFIPKENLLGKNILSFVAEKDIERAIENTRLMFEKPLGLQEYALKFEDGKEIDCEINGDVLFDAVDNPFGMVYVVRDITERKKTEQALKENEEKLRETNYMLQLSIEASNLGIWVHDFKENKIFRSGKWAEMLGYSKDEISNHVDDWKKLIHPEDKQYVEKLIKEHEEGKTPEFKVEHRLLCKSGNFKWILNQGKVTERDENGKPIKAAGIHLDIDEIKTTQEALRESEERYRLIADNTADNISVLGLDLKIQYVSPSIFQLRGYTVDEAMNQTLEQILTPESLKKVLTIFEKELAEELSGNIDLNRSILVELEEYKKNGSIIWVELKASFIRDDSNKPVGIIVITRDITERKYFEEKLRETNYMLQIAIDASNLGVWFQDFHNGKIYRSDKWAEMIGYLPEEVQNVTDEWLKFVHPDDLKLVEDSINAHKNGLAEEFKVEHRMQCKTGEYKWILNHGRITERDENGKPMKAAGIHLDIDEIKTTQEALLKSEERFQYAAKATSDVIYDWDLVTKEGVFSEAYSIFFGYKIRKESFDSWKKKIHPDDFNRAVNYTQDIINKSGTTWVCEYRFKNNSGNYANILDRGYVIRDNEGKPIRLIGTIMDITDRKRAEEELRILFRAIEQSQVSVVITDKEGNIEYINPHFTKTTGYSFHEVSGENPRILKSEKFTPKEYEEMWKQLSSGKQWSGVFHNKKKSGELFWESASISPITNDKGEITHYVAVKEDITEKIIAQEELEKYKHHLEELVNERTDQLNKQNIFLTTLIDTIPVPVFVKDNKERYTNINPAYEKLLNIKKEDIIGKTADYLFTGNSLKMVKKHDTILLDKQENIYYESISELKDGRRIPVLVYKASFGLPGAKPDGITGIFIDISERKKMEEQITKAYEREKELNELKTSFISMASHEFRTPLTSIFSSSELIEMYLGNIEDERIIKNLRRIQESVSGMTELLDDVLLISRGERGKLQFAPSDINLKNLCISLTDEAQHIASSKHTVDCNYNLNREAVYADDKLLRLILNNLLSNAVKYSPDGGKISFEINEINDMIQFKISDEGIGISEKDLKKVFEPFHRASNAYRMPGTGLGLNIALLAAELHGGYINVESKVNKGTTFTVLIKAK